jgi:sugar transferase (PEP-CTERM/EpsH1 system associated)
MSRIRIIHVIDSLGTGGAEEGVRKLLSGLDAAIFEQIVCTVVPPLASSAKAAIRVVSVGRPDVGRQLLVGRLRRLFRAERPHIVHSRNWGAIEAVIGARLASVPAVVHSEHGLESSTYRRQPWRRNLIRRGCYLCATKVFAVSQELRTYYARNLRINESRLDVIPNGVDTERFRRNHQMRFEIRQKLGVSLDTLVIGTVGRLDPIKDHRSLFQAADLLLAEGVPINLVIVGDGPERKALEADIKSREALAKRTHFIGNTSEIVSQLSGFDLFVLPSLAEGMSNALLEAMSAGLACVATRVGGNPELIEDRVSGLLFEAGNAKELAGHLHALALNVQRRRELGEQARIRMESSFSLNKMLNNYAQMYEGLAADITRKKAVLDYAVARPTRE